ncbi:MAG: hypothetical protein HWD86_10165 [Kangiellaceae bacterium]|nr:hypothetical protein [Kangiellaceae bacterium]
MSQPAVDPNVDQKQRSQNRKVVSALVLLFAAPVILAYVAFHMGWFNAASKNKGTILPSPYPRFEQFQWFDSEGQELHFKNFETRYWWIYFPQTNECDSQCDINMRLLTQTHAGLGKESEKLTRLVVFPSDIQYVDKVEKPEQLQLAKGNGQPTQGDGAQLEAGKIYAMDVHGNIFMQYEPVTNEEEAKLRSKDLRTDIRRVMKTTGL